MVQTEVRSGGRDQEEWTGELAEPTAPVQARRVLIYRLGSLGDMMVALPCFHLIARSFPNAERRLLTNLPVSPDASPAALILGASGLVHSYMSYPVGLRRLSTLRWLANSIRKWRPDLLVYLAGPRGFGRVFRDACFFRASGVRKIVGLPWRRDRRKHRGGSGGIREREAARLARCIGELGDVRLEQAGSWGLELTSSERARADSRLRKWPYRASYIACSIGTKVEVNDWGSENWQTLLVQMRNDRPSIGLLMVGAAEDHEKTDWVIAPWGERELNLCGVTTPRETAALLERARLFLGHDSGPLHLAASVGTRCVAVFSARNFGGVWFPYGENHRLIYRQVACAGCRLECCRKFKKACITSIGVDEVYQAINECL